MAPRVREKGWYPDPSDADRFQYWDGKEWNGVRQRGTNGVWIGHWSLRGWQKIWFGRLLRVPVVFYPLAWFNCSVPGTRGRLDRIMYPAQRRRISQ
jgi:hypothetical protein